ncbi:MAG: 50S ribosomal protein L14e [Candidatus Woesearchaeota archaeon]
MYTTGRVCLKTAGRDAGRYCVIVDEKEGKYLIDGQTRRRYVNAAHIEPLEEVLKIKKGASHEDVVAAFADLGVEVLAVQKQKDIVAKKPKKQ